MNYIAAIMSLFQSSAHRLSERSKILDIEFDYSVESFPQYLQLVDLIQSFPQRDNVVISLTNENDDLFYLSSKIFILSRNMIHLEGTVNIVNKYLQKSQ